MNLQRKSLVLLTFLFLSCCAFAELRSEKRAILNLHPGAVKVRALIRLAEYTQTSDSAESMRHATLAYFQAKALDDKKSQAEALLLMAMLEEKTYRPKRALLLSQRALQYSWMIQNKPLASKANLNIGRLYIQIQERERAFYALSQSISIYHELNDRNGENEAYLQMAEIFMQNTDYPKAMHYLKLGLQLQLQPDTGMLRLRNFTRIRDAFLKFHRYEKARNFYFKALEYARALTDTVASAKLLSSIAKCFYFNNDSTKATIYYQKAALAYRRLHQTRSEAAMLCNKGIVLDNSNSYDSALAAFSKAMHLMNLKQDADLLTRTMRRQAVIYTKRNELDRSKAILRKALQMDKAHLHLAGQAEDYQLMARNYLKAGDFNGTNHYLNLSDTVNKSLKLLLVFAENSHLRSDNYKNHGDERHALEHLRNYSMAQDTIFFRNKRKGNALRHARFNFEMKLIEDSAKIAEYNHLKRDAILNQEYEIEAQKLGRFSYFLGMVLIGFFAWLIAVLYRDRSLRAKHERDLLALENKDTLLNERIRIADEMHDDLGADLSNLLMKIHKSERYSPGEEWMNYGEMKSYTGTLIQNVDQIIWSLNSTRDSMADMMSFISRYFEAVAEKHKIRAEIDVPIDVPRINLTPRVRRDIFLAVKEALQNAIQHAHASNMELFFVFKFPMLHVTLIDNGVGFDTQTTEWAFGLTYLKKLIDRSNGTLHIHSDNKGTRVEMTFGIAPNLR